MTGDQKRLVDLSAHLNENLQEQRWRGGRDRGWGWGFKALIASYVITTNLKIMGGMLLRPGAYSD